MFGAMARRDLVGEIGRRYARRVRPTRRRRGAASSPAADGVGAGAARMLLLLLQPAAFAPTARVAASPCASPHAAPSSTPSFAMISSDGRAGTVLMAGGRGKKAPRPASGGFGAAKPPPPTLESVCAGFPTRLPSDAASTPCVCGSGDAYACCCQPYHLGEKRAESAERCVRTRYSGFAYRLPRYIIETTHRTNRDYMKDKVKWARRAHRSPTPLPQPVARPRRSARAHPRCRA